MSVTGTRPVDSGDGAVRAATPPDPGSLRHRVGFWLTAAVFTLAMAFATVPTPLYPRYEKADGFGSFVVTVVFATYAVGVLAALFLAGHLSDWYGRRALLLPALGFGLASAVVFTAAHSLPALLAGRLVSGFSVGLLAPTATAYLDDLHRRARPGADRTRAGLVATGANLGGLGLGALVSGLVVDHAGDPMRAPYVLFLAVLGLAVVATLVVPETVDRADPMPAYRPQRMSMPDDARPAFFAAAAIAFTAFALFGLLASLAPMVLTSLHVASPPLSGLAVFLVFDSAAFGQIAVARAAADRQLRWGLAALAAGLVMVTASVWALSLALFLGGAFVGGAGAGIAFKGGVSTVMRLSLPERRSESLAAMFLAAYVGLSVPTLAVGLATQRFPMRDAVVVLVGVLLAVVAWVAAAVRRL